MPRHTATSSIQWSAWEITTASYCSSRKRSRLQESWTSVSTALGRLQERGFLERTENGQWLLLGPPPKELAEVAGAASPD